MDSQFPHDSQDYRDSQGSQSSQEIPGCILLNFPLSFPAVTCAIRQVYYISHLDRVVAWLVEGSSYDIDGDRVWGTERFILVPLPDDLSPGPRLENEDQPSAELHTSQGKFVSSPMPSRGEWVCVTNPLPPSHPLSLLKQSSTHSLGSESPVMLSHCPHPLLLYLYRPPQPFASQLSLTQIPDFMHHQDEDSEDEEEPVFILSNPASSSIERQANRTSRDQTPQPAPLTEHPEAPPYQSSSSGPLFGHWTTQFDPRVNGWSENLGSQ